MTFQEITNALQDWLKHANVAKLPYISLDFSNAADAYRAFTLLKEQLKPTEMLDLLIGEYNSNPPTIQLNGLKIRINSPLGTLR